MDHGIYLSWLSFSSSKIKLTPILRDVTHNSLLTLNSWIETSGKTLEEIDEMFDGEKHTTVPTVEEIIKGKGDTEVLFGQPVGEEIIPVPVVDKK